MIEITKKYGWQKNAWLILWHQRGTYGTDNYVWNYFKPFIDGLIKERKIRKGYWAMFDEFKSIQENKEQIYGLYTGNFTQFPISDIDNVDKRRAEIGKPPLWYMHEVYNIDLPKGYNYKNKIRP